MRGGIHTQVLKTGNAITTTYRCGRTFTNFVSPSADPSRGAEALEAVLPVDAVAFAATDYVPASLFGAT